MSESNKERWLSWLALSTAFMAVISAVTTMYMGKFSSRAVLMQGQETDQWAYYQAKSIKSHTFEMQKQALELQLLAQGKSLSPEATGKFTEKIRDYDREIKRYEGEKKEIKAKAEDLAKNKIVSQHMGGNFGYGLLFVQVAIMMTSIASLMKKKPLWYFGLAAMLGWIFFSWTQSICFIEPVQAFFFLPPPRERPSASPACQAVNPASTPTNPPASTSSG
jgi:hypothetical protein